MAFGAGVLLSAVSFELLDEAHKEAGLVPTAVGTLLGAAAYTAGNVWLGRRSTRHRKRSGHREQQPSEEQQAGSGSALALGALLDGVPESAAIGVSLLGGSGTVSLVTVAEPRRLARHPLPPGTVTWPIPLGGGDDLRPRGGLRCGGSGGTLPGRSSCPRQLPQRHPDPPLEYWFAAACVGLRYTGSLGIVWRWVWSCRLSSERSEATVRP